LSFDLNRISRGARLFGRLKTSTGFEQPFSKKVRKTLKTTPSPPLMGDESFILGRKDCFRMKIRMPEPGLRPTLVVGQEFANLSRTDPFQILGSVRKSIDFELSGERNICRVNVTQFGTCDPRFPRHAVAQWSLGKILLCVAAACWAVAAADAQESGGPVVARVEMKLTSGDNVVDVIEKDPKDTAPLVNRAAVQTGQG